MSFVIFFFFSFFTSFPPSHFSGTRAWKVWIDIRKGLNAYARPQSCFFFRMTLVSIRLNIRVREPTRDFPYFCLPLIGKTLHVLIFNFFPLIILSSSFVRSKWDPQQTQELERRTRDRQLPHHIRWWPTMDSSKNPAMCKVCQAEILVASKC